MGWCAALLAVPAVLCVSSCSRQEKPAAPEKKAQAFTVAPTPAAAVDRVATGQVARLELDKKPLARHIPQRSPDEAAALKKRVRQAQKDYAEQVRANELQRKELELREKDPRMKEAFARVEEARESYAKACLQQIPGYQEDLQKSESLQARLQALVARKNRGEAVDPALVKEALGALNQALVSLSEARGKANSGDPVVARAFQDVLVTQAAYQECLSAQVDAAAADAGAAKTSRVVTNLMLNQGK